MERADIRQRIPEIRALCEKFGVVRLELFGSALTDKFDPEKSDFDFLVEFSEARKGASFFEVLEFKYALESLCGRPIDVIEPSAVSNPFIRKSIESGSQLLYAA